MTNNDRDRAVSKEKLNQFVMKVANDFGAAWSAVLVNIGDKLGLYKEMVNSGPITSEELAKRYWNGRTLHKRMVSKSSCWRLCYL